MSVPEISDFRWKIQTFRSENSDKEFKPKREGNETRPRKRAEKVEYKGDKKTSFRTERKENDKKNFLAKIVLHVLLLMTDALSRHPHLVTCTVVVQTKKIQKMKELICPKVIQKLRRSIGSKRRDRNFF